jgi:hypothetical protein
VILRPTLPYVAPVPAALLAVMLGVISTPAVVAVAASATLCALARATIESIRIEVLRDRADGWIVAHVGRQPSDEVVLGRTRELVDPRTRATLAVSFRRLAAGSEAVGWSPVYANRCHLRAHRHELADLARELGDLSRPVTPRGVALAHRLIAAAGSPLYDSHRANELRLVVRQTIAALDGPGGVRTTEGAVRMDER